MANDTFTEPTEPAEDWNDVRMNDPGRSGWKVDMVVDIGDGDQPVDDEGGADGNDEREE